ncbi:hypothetical protein CRYUN_Cryun16bG0079500 [Craigia yunnanensis]
MGKILLEFQSTKGDVLPAHKFGTHDLVVLKPNKAYLGSAALGQGVVYWLKDLSITVAFDDVPEDGLNSPLRLKKVANEVGFLSDRRRMNVAVTRARRQCCLVCDTETVSSDVLKRLVEYFDERDKYLSASENCNE